LGHVRNIHRAHWDGAKQSSTLNYKYVTKDSKFLTAGDFYHEKDNLEKLSKRGPALIVPKIIKGLLNPATCWQTKVTPTYSELHKYYDKVAGGIATLKENHELFNERNVKILKRWQYSCLWMVMTKSTHVKIVYYIIILVDTIYLQ